MHICKKFFSLCARHKKTGNIYKVCEDTVTDCTNSRDGTECVIYERNGKLFVREISEFREKFDMIKTKS